MSAVLLPMCVWGQKIVFTPQWTPQAQFAGYYVALEKGFYEEVGLDVSIEHPSASNNCLNKLKNGESQIVTLQLFSALRQMEEDGIQLVNVLQTSQQNTLVIASHTPLDGVESLRGKRVGRWLAGFSELIDIINLANDLNIEWIPFIQNVNLFISGAIDATVVMIYNEYYQLIMAGQRLKPEQLLYFRDIGYNIPEDGVYVTEKFYRTHKDEVRRFCEATRKGWLWCAEHPDEALDIVMDVVHKAHIGTNRHMQKFMLDEVLYAQQDKDTGERTFTLSREALELSGRLLLQYGYISTHIDYDKFTGQ